MNKEKYILKLNIWELQVITSLTNHCIDCAIEEKEILDCLSCINKEINFKNKRGF